MGPFAATMASKPVTSKKVVMGNVQHKVHYYNKSIVDPSLNKLNSAVVDRLSSLSWNCSQQDTWTPVLLKSKTHQTL
jgi:hypothetical protein